jgi:hypothetical protein
VPSHGAGGPQLIKMAGCRKNAENSWRLSGMNWKGDAYSLPQNWEVFRGAVEEGFFNNFP